MTTPGTEGDRATVGTDNRRLSVAPGAELADLVSVESLHLLQDRFAGLGQVTVCVCTMSGERITEPTWGGPFSALIGTSPLGRKMFSESFRALARVPSTNVPSMCIYGMTLYAAPIVHDGRQLALIIVGTRPATPPASPGIGVIAEMFDLDPGELQDACRQVTEYTGATPEAAHRFADALANTIATLYGQAERIERQLDDLRIVAAVSDLLSGTLELVEILDLTVQRVVEVMGVKACGIRLLDEESGELVIKAVHNLSSEYLQKGPVMLAENAVDAAAFAGEAVFLADMPNDPRTRYPENARREGIVSALCVPMTYRGKTVGVLRVYTARRYVFSEAEKSLLRSIGSQAASAIINSRLFEQEAAAARVQRQIETAGEIQRRMLPARPPEHPGLQLGCAYAPALQVGGDFYDFIELADGRLGVCIADVVGKGLPAALLMASVRSSLDAYAREYSDPGEVMTRVNRHVHRETLISEFATLFYGVFSPDGRSITYCNAGHTPPLLLHADRFTELTVGGLVIGVDPEEAFGVQECVVRPGEVLVLMTDGVTEAMDFHGQPYGGDRLRESIRKHRSQEAQQLAGQILWDVRRFVGLADQSDDITIAVIKAL